MSSSLRSAATLRSGLRTITASTQPTQQHRCLSNLIRPLIPARSCARSRPILCSHFAVSNPIPSPIRHHSTLPVQQHYIPRKYPFPIILTTELLLEEDVEMHRSTPHDLPPYKSTLTCNIHDLPLTAAEKRVFRLLVGARMYSHTFHSHPVPTFLTSKQTPHIPKHRRQRAKDSAVRVRFVSRHLGSAQANENRVFQLLDESIRASKVLVAEMAADGQWVEEGEDEAVLREALWRFNKDKSEARRRRKEETGEDTQKSDEGQAVEGQQAPMIGEESVGRAAEKQRVSREASEQTAAGDERQ